MMVEPSHKIRSILGIDNTSDPTRIGLRRGGGIFLTEADNVDIDDEGMPHRRKGYEDLLLSGDIHSLWSDGKKLGLFVQGTEFKKLNTDHTATTLITDIDPTDQMCYVAVNNIVYFSNSSIIGYIRDGQPYPFPNPHQTFKQGMVGGHILEYYNNRLYAAYGNTIYFSDATVLTRMDKRKNAIPFSDRITMMKAVLNGIFVSAGDHISFMEGGDPFQFTYRDVSNVPAIERTAITVEEENIGRGEKGKAVYWLTELGVYRGLPGGMITQMQDGLFSIRDIDAGMAVLRDDNGYQQYLAIVPLKPGVGGASGEFRVPNPVVTGD
ncbi:MAG: hypothetical protein EHM49_08530 [Deltaproteobacteria bacterium]|nr:MAG: hypothetical protein EHM49_08530 [Deltaproteobacteria bacterium]